MNFLKKTLGKEQIKKNPTKFPNSLIRKHQTVQIWNNNIDELMEKKAHKKQQTSFDRSINLIIQQKIKHTRFLELDDYQNVINLFVDAYKRHDRVSKIQKGNTKWEVCRDLAKRLKTKAQDPRISKFIHELEIQRMINQKDQKRKKIEEFDTMVSFKNLKPQIEHKNIQFTQLKHFQSAEKQKQEKKNHNLSRNQSKSKKSLKSAKNLSSSSLKRQTLSRKRSQGDLHFSKLQHLLKDVSTKVVKGNIQYDYSSILEGSKSNIQCRKNNRNMTQKQEPKAVQKKVKKNQAFVFYRPGK